MLRQCVKENHVAPAMTQAIFALLPPAPKVQRVQTSACLHEVLISLSGLYYLLGVFHPLFAWLGMRVLFVVVGSIWRKHNLVGRQ